jgi:hypothetical protein
MHHASAETKKGGPNENKETFGKPLNQNDTFSAAQPPFSRACSFASLPYEKFALSNEPKIK